MGLQTKETSIRQLGPHKSWTPLFKQFFPLFPEAQWTSLSSWGSARWTVLRVFLADPRLSSPRSGAREVLALRTMRPKLSTCGHVWCPAAACSHITSHLTLCEPTLVLWEPHKEPAAMKESCSYVCSCHLLFASCDSGPNPNSHCITERNHLLWGQCFVLISIAACIETPPKTFLVMGRK